MGWYGMAGGGALLCWPERVPQRVIGTTFTDTASIPVTCRGSWS